MKKELSSEKLAQYFSADPDLCEEEREEIIAELQNNRTLRKKIGASGSYQDTSASTQRLLQRISQNDISQRNRTERTVSLNGFSRRHSVKPANRFLRMAAVFGLLATVLFLTYFIAGQQTAVNGESVVWQATSTQKGQLARVTLSEGTEIVLGVDSRLEYPRGLEGEVREVHLSGEAYFNVTNSDDRPFLIYAGGTVTEVLGTSFNVRSYNDEKEISIVVADGRVSFRTENGDPSDGVILEKGQMGRIQRDDMSIMAVESDVNLGQLLGWKEGRLVFVDAQFGEVKSYLEKWYNIEIVFSDDELKRERLTGTFQDESIQDMLKIIAISLDLNYEVDNRRIIFTLN